MVTATKKPLRSNDKSIIAKNQREFLSEFPAKEYGAKTNREAFASQIDALKYNGRSTQTAVRDYVDGGALEYTYYGRAKYLNKIGLKKYDPDKQDLTDRQWEEVNRLYENLMVRDGTKLYEDIKAGKTKPVKKKPTKKKPEYQTKQKVRKKPTTTKRHVSLGKKAVGSKKRK